MTKNWLLTEPKRGSASCGSRTRLPPQATRCLAGRFAPCRECKRRRAAWVGLARAGLGLGFLLRRAAALAQVAPKPLAFGVLNRFPAAADCIRIRCSIEARESLDCWTAPWKRWSRHWCGLRGLTFELSCPRRQAL